MEKSLSQKLYENEIIKFGEFKLKSGQKSPIYVNLRKAQANFKLFNDICTKLYEKTSYLKYTDFDIICGVPYGAISYAMNLNFRFYKKPFITIRKEKKKYGMKNLIDGDYKEGTRCLLIEDVVTTGSSLLETIKRLEENGIVVSYIFTIIDRKQGGMDIIRNYGYNIESVFNLKTILSDLLTSNSIAFCTYNRTLEYLKISMYKTENTYKRIYDLIQRKYFSKNILCRKLYDIMIEKKTNLALSLDVSNKKKFLSILMKCAPHICILKTHCDIIDDFDDEFIQKVTELSETYKFIIMEDRKFSDIGATFRKQLCGGIYKINSWAHCITLHSIAGNSLLDVYSDINSKRNDRGVVIVSEMSNKNNLITEDYTNKSYKLGEKYSVNVVGFVCQNRPKNILQNDEFVFMTPGISLKTKQDKLDQKYRTPYDAILSSKTDIIIVGRGITMSKNPRKTAIQYKQQGWDAYIKKIS